MLVNMKELLLTADKNGFAVPAFNISNYAMFNGMGQTVANGTAVFDGMAYVDASVTGGSSVTLSQYTSSSNGGGNNNRPGGR